MVTVEPGDRIYYTGDMANRDGWGSVVAVGTHGVTLKLDDDRKAFTIEAHGIGAVYQGHCNPRFVTEAAVKTYRETIATRLKAAADA